MPLNSEWTAEDFKKATGHEAVQDDLERCNCKQAGKSIGHSSCGVCKEHNIPVFMCKICFAKAAFELGSVELI